MPTRENEQIQETDTAEVQRQELLGQLRDTRQSLERIQEIRQRSDAQIVESPVPEITPPDEYDIAPTGALAILDAAPSPEQELQAIQEREQQRLQQVETERADIREEREGLVDRLRDVWDRIRPTEDIVREERRAMGVDTMLQKQQSLLRDIDSMVQNANSLIDRRDAAIGMVGQFGVETPFLTGEKARIAEAYDRRISSVAAQVGAKNAYLAAIQGQVEQARGLISDIVEAYTYDTQMELNKISAFIDLNHEELSSLDNEYLNLLNSTKSYWQQRYNEERQEREAVLRLMVEVPEAGISGDESISEASKKASEWLALQPSPELLNLMTNPDFAAAGITRDDTIEEAMAKISALPDPDERRLVRSLGIEFSGAGIDTENDSLQQALDRVRDFNPEVRQLAINYAHYGVSPSDTFASAINKIASGRRHDDLMQQWGQMGLDLTPAQIKDEVKSFAENYRRTLESLGLESEAVKDEPISQREAESNGLILEGSGVQVFQRELDFYNSLPESIRNLLVKRKVPQYDEFFNEIGTRIVWDMGEIPFTVANELFSRGNLGMAAEDVDSPITFEEVRGFFHSALHGEDFVGEPMEEWIDEWIIEAGARGATDDQIDRTLLFSLLDVPDKEIPEHIRERIGRKKTELTGRGEMPDDRASFGPISVLRQGHIGVKK